MYADNIELTRRGLYKGGRLVNVESFFEEKNLHHGSQQLIAPPCCTWPPSVADGAGGGGGFQLPKGDLPD